ncbi:MAG: sortase [Clostridiales bacterium]|nr:sortase [Clostridiales bacterium]
MNRKHKAGLALMAAGVLLMAAAVGLLLYNRAEDREAGESVDELMPVLRQEMAVRESRAEEAFYFPAEEDEGEGAEETGPTEESVTVDGYDYIGILTIPALGLELPVMADWDYTRLKIAPCRYTGSVETGDLTIAAHNYSRHFGRLKNLAGGEEVIFTDMDGNRTRYLVAETEILEPTAIEEMTGSGYPLSLFTCTYGGQTRVTVRCDYYKE